MATLPIDSLHSLSIALGEMPEGDLPVCWFISFDPDVLQAWDRFCDDYRAWMQTWNRLLEISGLPPATQIVTSGTDTLQALSPPPGVKTPTGWRKTATGHLVPRRRTRGEKASEANRLWAALEVVPQAAQYLTGMPPAIWVNGNAYPIHVRKPAKAVCAFVGVDPDAADPPFEPDGRWTRMKLSTFVMLLERQRAGA